MASPDRYTFCVYGTGPVRALILEDYDSVAPQGTGRAKVGENYLPLILYIEKAS